MRRVKCIAGLAWLLVFGLFAAAESQNLVIGALKGPSGLGMIRLLDAPPKLPDGISLGSMLVPSADIMAAKLISGECSAAVLPLNMAAKLAASGIDIGLLAIVGEGMLSFLSSDPSLVSLAGLKAQEVHIAGQGATPDYLFRTILHSAALEPDRDVRLVYALQPPEAAAALAAGRIKYAVLPEPFATQARGLNPSLSSPVDLGKLWTAVTGQASYPMTAFVVSAKLAKAQPQALRILSAAYADSIAWVRANPKQAGALAEKLQLGIRADVAEKSIPASAFVYIPANRARPSVEALLGVFLNLAPASVGGKLPDASFYLSLE